MLNSKRKNEKAEAILCEGGFILAYADKTSDILLWNEVSKILAYKVDRFTADTICVAFERQEKGDTFYIDEEVRNFDQVVIEMGKVFPPIDPDWFSKVMKPAFVENLTILYER